MDLNEKIKQILADKNISPSIFADEIGIQRSSMSHIIAGRNKPSLEIVQKIVKRFPDLGVSWIFEGEPLQAAQPSGENRTFTKTTELPRAPRPRVNARQEPESARIIQAQENKISTEKKIERVLIFYTDGSYKEYREAD